MRELYLFPEVKNPSSKNLCRTEFECGKKILEEAMECFDESKNAEERRHEMLIECLDTIHACETMLRRYFSDVEVKAGIAKVYAKNAKRGFYD